MTEGASEYGIRISRLFDAPPERVTSLDVPMPYARNLEELVLPSPARVIATVRRLLGVEETVGAPVPPARVQRGR